MRRGKHVACTEEMRNIQQMAGQPQGKGPFGRPICRWKNNVGLHLKETDERTWTGSP